jgi:group I intron endonuclease
MVSGVYVIENRINHKVYIGSAFDIEKRWQKHVAALERGKHHNRHLQSSWNKRGGIAAFRFRILEITETSKLVEREQWWLDVVKPFEKQGYNLSPTAGSTLGVKYSEEARRNIALSIDYNSEEYCRKQSKSHMGKKPSAETREKMSNAHVGKTHLLEARRKIAEANRNRPPASEEYRRKQAEAHRGKIASEETRRKMSAAHRRRHQT